MACAVDEGLEAEEKLRDVTCKKDSSVDVWAEILVVRHPYEDLLLKYERIFVASLGYTEVEIDTVLVFNIESELSNYVRGICHDDVAEFVE